MERQKLRMIPRSEGPRDEVTATIPGNYALQLGKVIRVHLIVLDEVGGNFVVLLVRKRAYDLHFELGLAVKEQLGGGDTIGLHELHDQLHDVELVEELEFDYDVGGFGKAAGVHVHFRKLREIVWVDYFLQLQVLHVVENHL